MIQPLPATLYRGFTIEGPSRILGHYYIVELEAEYATLAAAKRRVDRELR